MRFCRFATVVVAFALSVSGVGAQPARQSRAPTGLIVGQVVDATTGRPIAGAIVTIGGVQSAPATGQTVRYGNQRVLTTPEGRFLFRDIPRGNVTLSAIKPGYVPGEVGRRRPDGASQPITLADGDRVADAVIRLWKYAAITGTVIDEAGEPIVGLQIRAFRRSFVSGRRRFVLATAARTDDRGIYRLGDLTPGDYVVVSSGRQIMVPLAVARELQSGSPGVQELGFPVQPGTILSIQLGDTVYSAGPGNAVPPPPTGDRPFVYPTIYYPAATSAGQATIVTVASGEERAAVDLELRPVPTLRVSGVLTGSDGPATGRAVRLLSSDFFDITLMQDTPATITDRMGVFAFPAVPAGQYTLAVLPTARATGPGNTTDQVTWARAPVALGRSDVDGLAIALENGLRISGRLEFDGTRARPDLPALRSVSLIVDPVESITTGSGVGRTSNPDADGEFTTFGVPAGRYLLRIPGSPVGWMFKSAMHNGRDISEVPFDLQSDLSGVVVTFTDRWTGVGGAVLTPQGNPDPNATVVVFSTDATHWANGVSARRVKITRPAKSGQYGINSLPPGEYFIVALPEDQAADWQDPKFLEAASAIASKFTIGDGERATQDLRTKEIR
jgi:Carboxypeptidase regulatory-like domain